VLPAFFRCPHKKPTQTNAIGFELDAANNLQFEEECLRTKPTALDQKWSLTRPPWGLAWRLSPLATAKLRRTTLT